MSTQPTNPPAFPTPVIPNDHCWHNGDTGMSLLDHFAGLAMQSMMANPELFKGVAEFKKVLMTNGETTDFCDGLISKATAMAAYDQAAAMLAERQRRGEAK